MKGGPFGEKKQNSSKTEFLRPSEEIYHRDRGFSSGQKSGRGVLLL
jgi:hypothetical protein